MVTLSCTIQVNVYTSSFSSTSVAFSHSFKAFADVAKNFLSFHLNLILVKEVVDDVVVVAAVGVVEVEHLGRRLHLTQRQWPMWRKFPKIYF